MKPYLLAIIMQAACTLAWAQSPKSAPENPIYAQAVAAYQQQDYARAFALLKPLAEQGDMTAQHNLAVLYQDGLGVRADMVQAAYWYEQAAQQGETEAQFMLGLIYSDGIGVTQDYERAAHWYRQAALQGHADAQNNLAARYATGTGVDKNTEEALKWYAQAAAQGHPTAAFTLQQLRQSIAKP